MFKEICVHRILCFLIVAYTNRTTCLSHKCCTINLFYPFWPLVSDSWVSRLDGVLLIYILTVIIQHEHSAIFGMVWPPLDITIAKLNKIKVKYLVWISKHIQARTSPQLFNPRLKLDCSKELKTSKQKNVGWASDYWKLFAYVKHLQKNSFAVRHPQPTSNDLSDQPYTVSCRKSTNIFNQLPSAGGQLAGSRKNSLLSKTKDNEDIKKKHHKNLISNKTLYISFLWLNCQLRVLYSHEFKALYLCLKL